MERSSRGFRFSRQTFGKPKYSTYGGPCCIVDGSDGRTYLLHHSSIYDFIKVSRSDFKDACRTDIGFESAVFPQHEQYQTLKDEQYQTLKALIHEANAAELATA